MHMSGNVVNSAFESSCKQDVPEPVNDPGFMIRQNKTSDILLFGKTGLQCSEQLFNTVEP